MRDSEGFVRMRTLQCVVLFVFLLIGGRLAYIQLIDSRYNELAKANVLRHVVQYPPRGEVFDRNGEYLVQSRECYDLMVIYSEIDKKGFDTLRMCEVLGLSREKLEKELANARMRPRAPRVVTSYISKEDKLRFDECNFRGFYAVYRTVRRYPRKVGGNLLGFVGEVNADFLKRHPDYKSGDYVGMSGVESAYEPLLKGRKGVKIQEIDTHGAIKGSYMNGVYDSLPEPGRYLVSTIDARLQLLGEELMRGKVGAAVAIEPSTGEILMMVSSPTYDPDELVGRERGNNYMKMIYNKRHPLFSRAVKAKYPPGSTFKLVQGLIGLQEGVLRPSDLHVCHEGYQVGRRRMKCHAHASPLDLRFAVATSCNAYFCYVFRDILDNRKYESVKDGYDVWKEYVESFGFGRKLGSDFLDEGNGYVPDRSYYDRQYRGSWNSLTVISLAIGQDALGCTPLQLANLAAIVANRGYYYVPHIVKKIEGKDSLDRRFYERHYTKVDPKHFEPIVDGMWRGVNVGGTSTAARLEGLDVCGKTGTAENPRCTPLQLANLAAIVANRGYYYVPHIVKKIEGKDSLDRRFYERHYTKVDPKHFEPIVDGMWRGVNVGGTSTAARLEGLDVCGKTGTAENPRGRDHSTFLSFAPKDNPKIAISVYVENGGFGASAALPIASLLEEYYLTDTIRRPALLEHIKNMNIYYPSYDR
ncbi:peptidoglycan D,D-transpeptidase FtsI family protein [Alistipes finegoldii]|uniref:peptidoglycan D,D-transpeptidase FtsI family protein n=1 Tax=Alistipes finegoldii TaxID=214856 RepID=UPI00241D05C7|nr:penicillin-binding transpeptidase domain-containing protein [Alistipes finegoldii]